jgi:hypothetical protein
MGRGEVLECPALWCVTHCNLDWSTRPVANDPCQFVKAGLRSERT